MRDPLAGRWDAAAVALLLGLAATVAALAARAWWHRRRPERPAPVVGLALAAAGTAGIAATGATGLGAGGRQVALPWPVLVLLVVSVGALLADFGRHWRQRGLAPVLLAVTTAGVYLAVPDVEAALVVFGVALPLSLLGWPGPLGRASAETAAAGPPSLGGVGAFAVAGLLVWTAATGSAGRPGAFVGALACLGVLVVEPLARRLDPGRGSPLGPVHGRWAARSALAAQLVLVAISARVVGRPAGVAAALVLAALELGVALAAALVVARSYGERTVS